MRTIGGGTVLDPVASRYRRRDKTLIPRLELLKTEDTGRIVEGEMCYSATTRDADSGQETRHKLTFIANEDGTVRQLWEQSTDDEESWQVAFDGRYTRRPATRVSENR